MKHYQGTYIEFISIDKRDIKTMYCYSRDKESAYNLLSIRLRQQYNGGVLLHVQPVIKSNQGRLLRAVG